MISLRRAEARGASDETKEKRDAREPCFLCIKGKPRRELPFIF